VRNKNQVRELANLINEKREKPIPRSWTRFLDHWIDTGNITESAMKTFKVKDKKSASTYGGRVLKRLGVSNEVQAALIKAGMTRDWRFDILKRNTKSGSDKALEMALKIGGDFPKEGMELSTAENKPIKVEIVDMEKQ
jgi:hypothetical protein